MKMRKHQEESPCFFNSKREYDHISPLQWGVGIILFLQITGTGNTSFLVCSEFINTQIDAHTS